MKEAPPIIWLLMLTSVLAAVSLYHPIPIIWVVAPIWIPLAAMICLGGAIIMVALLFLGLVGGFAALVAVLVMVVLTLILVAAALTAVVVVFIEFMSGRGAYRKSLKQVQNMFRIGKK